jgi:glycosyltransferase involved in cell wall biosynthesis
MKVLMIEPIGYSGICIYTAQLCKGLQAAGTEIALLTSRLYDPGVMKPGYAYHAALGGCDRRTSRIRRAWDYLQSWKALPRILRAEKPDAIHFQNTFVPPMDLLVLLFLKMKGYPIAYTVHDVDRSALMTRQRARIVLNRFVDRLVYRAVDRLIVHTQGSMEELRSAYAIPPAKIERIEHGNQAFHLEGVEIPEQAEARKRLGLEAGAFAVLFFGDRRPSKGLDLLIRALAKARGRAPGIRLLIAGERRVLDATDYEGLAAAEGVRDLCAFHDRFIPNEEVPFFFAACDIVALPYRKIYQSGVVHLAFAFGRPVLASRVGGLEETVEEGRTGFFVEDPEDIDGLADALARAYGSRGSLPAMGAEARRVEMEEHGWEEIAKKTLRLYEAMKAAR